METRRQDCKVGIRNQRDQIRMQETGDQTRLQQEREACLAKLLRLRLSKPAFPSCRKHDITQPEAEKGDHSHPLHYRPTALSSCLSRAFE